jgi:hypothetical protein
MGIKKTSPALRYSRSAGEVETPKAARVRVIGPAGSHLCALPITLTLGAAHLDLSHCVGEVR